MASNALPNIMDDPAAVKAEIIQSPFNDPRIKYIAWREMLRSRAPDSSKARVAAIALETSHTYITTVREYQRVLRDMRISAIDTIRVLGVEDDSVYTYLERTYRSSFVTASTDFDEINLVVRTLSAIGSDEAVDLLTDFLNELHTRRRSGPWGNTERDIMQMIITGIASTGTESQMTTQLLATIQNSSVYTYTEQNWARTALRALGR
jgi:hypothetical protein